MYRVVPATSSLLSRLPAWTKGGAVSILPPAGATPMLPKKGRSGISMPGAKWPIIFLRSSGTTL